MGERQLTYPEGGPNDNETYAEDGSGEDNIDTEDLGPFLFGCCLASLLTKILQHIFCTY